MYITNQMELFCRAYATAISAHAGFDVNETNVDDDSIDVSITGRIFGRPRIDVQLKATYQVSPLPIGTSFPFILSIKNYDDLRLTPQEFTVPRLLVVLLMPRPTQHTGAMSQGNWTQHGANLMTLYHTAYYLNLRAFPSVTSTSTTVQVPWVNVFNETQLTSMMTHVGLHKDLP